MYQWIKVKARKKACKTFFYGEIKERRETGEHTRKILVPYPSTETTQDKKKARQVPID